MTRHVVIRVDSETAVELRVDPRDAEGYAAGPYRTVPVPQDDQLTRDVALAVGTMLGRARRLTSEQIRHHDDEQTWLAGNIATEAMELGKAAARLRAAFHLEEKE